MNRPRGFTLIEMVIAMTVSLLAFGAASTVYVQVNIQRRLGMARSLMLQDANLAMGWLRRDIYAAGSGIGQARTLLTGANGAGTAVTGYSALFPAVIPDNTPRTAANSPAFPAQPMTAVSASMGFTVMGDVPRPDSLFDGLSAIPMRVPGSGCGSATACNTLALVNELSGRLTSGSTAANGRIGAVNAVPPCSNAAPMHPDALGCPWGYRKYAVDADQSGAGGRKVKNIQVIYPSGEWESATLASFPAPSAGAEFVVTLADNLAHPGLPAGFYAPLPSGVVTQVDRIGYLFDRGTRRLYRRQCWAPPITGGNQAVGFALALGGVAPNCTVGEDDTDWVAIARDLDLPGTSVTMLDEAGSPTQNPAAVTSIRVDLSLRRNVRVGGASRAVAMTLSERFFLRARTY